MAGHSGETAVHVMNLSEPYRATQLWSGIVESFESGMEVGRHWRQLKYYDDSFTASEAVNYLLRHLQRNPNFGLSVTRLQSVQLLRKLHKAKVFEDVRGAKYDREDFTENNSRLYRFCHRNAGPRSPFSFCRALINVHTPGKSFSPAEPSVGNKVKRMITFDDKENQMLQDDFLLKRRNIPNENVLIKQFMAKEDVPVRQSIPVKEPTPTLKENQSLLGALQQTLLPKIPVMSEFPNSIYSGQTAAVQPFKPAAQSNVVSLKQSKNQETGTRLQGKAMQRRALMQVNVTPHPKSVELGRAGRQVHTANRDSQKISQFETIEFPTLKANTCISVSQRTGEKRQTRVGTAVVRDSAKQPIETKPSNLPTAGQHGTTQQINTGIRSALSLWKKPSALSVNEDELKQRCFDEFKVRLCIVLGVNDLNEFYVPAPGDHENVFRNLTCADGEGYPSEIDREGPFPAWLHSAMKYLTHWPLEAVGSLPKYSGFEKDVFQAVVDYFEGPDVKPIFMRRLSQAVSKSFVHLNFREQENATEDRKEEKEEEACMETSFGLGTDEPRTRLIRQLPIRCGRVPRARSCLAQPRVIASPLKNCSNPMSLVASGLDLSQVPGDREYNGSSLSYLYSMPDVSFLDQPLFDTTAGVSRCPKKALSYSGFQSQKDMSAVSVWGNAETNHNRRRHRPTLSLFHSSLPSEETIPRTGFDDPFQLAASEAGGMKPMRWDRSQSIMHLPDARCQCPADYSSSTYCKTSHSCANLAQQSRRSCDLKSHSHLDNTSESSSLFYLTRSTSRGAVTASYRLAVDKNESFSTPVGKSLFSSATNHHKSLATRRDNSEKFLDVLQMFSLLLPVSEHCRLIILLRFLGRISANEDLVLDEQLSVCQMVWKHFVCAVFHIDSSSDGLMLDILAFMVDHFEDATRIPEALGFVARDFNEKLQNSKAVNKSDTGMAGKKDWRGKNSKASPSRIMSANLESVTSKIQSRNKVTSMFKKPIERLRSMRF